jgi:hypothetical protein
MLSDLIFFVQIAYWLSLGLLVASLGLVVATLWVQRAVEASARRRALTFSVWREALEEGGSGAHHPSAPDPRDAFVVLCAWCDLVADETSGADAERLRRLAFESNLDRVARGFLHGRDPAAKIAGARALGYLGEPSENAVLKALTAAPDRELALAARVSLRALSARRPLRLESGD